MISSYFPRGGIGGKEVLNLDACEKTVLFNLMETIGGMKKNIQR